MKPKPLESLNHLTVPVAIYSFLFAKCRDISGRDEAGHDDQGRELTASTDATSRTRPGAAVRVQIRCLKITAAGSIPPRAARSTFRWGKGPAPAGGGTTFGPMPNLSATSTSASRR